VEPPTGDILDESSLRHLPSPVARSLGRSGVVGRPIPRHVQLRQRGEILLRDRWFPFTAKQVYTLDPPSFEWVAGVKVAGLPIVRAKDSLASGHGRMHVRLLNLFTVVDATGTEMDQGALMRWLNETMWFPHVWATDLITWQPVDDVSAVGRISVGDTTVEAEFRFDSEGRFVDFRGDRYRIDADVAALVPWRTPITGYGSFAGIEVPISGSALWELEAGDLEYIRLQITDIRYA
jgi:hypothetical protein